MNLQNIFNHLSDTLIFIGKAGGFNTYEKESKALITGLSSPVFNYISLKALKDPLIDQLIRSNIPFICLPNQLDIHDFEKLCTQKTLIKADEVIAHEFTHLYEWQYQKPSEIVTHHIQDDKGLCDFDDVSSLAFQHPKGMAKTFLEPLLNIQTISMYVTYRGKKPIACGILSCVNNMAGLYWGGVLPDYQRKVVGKALTEYRMKCAKERSFSKIFAQNMTPSISYYKAIGFSPVGSLPLYLYSPN